MTDEPPADAAAALPLRTAVELATAVAVDAAAAAGVRCLVLKGVGCERQGLRTPRPIGDVDLLVPPETREAVAAVLVARGWFCRPEDQDQVTFPRHSTTMIHPGWPCDIDVHDRFPGIGVSATAAFGWLWSGRSAVLVAGRSVAVPGPPDHIVLLALHALRTLDRTRHRADLSELIDLVSGSATTRTSTMRPTPLAVAVAVAATALGALGTARPFLEHLGLEEAIHRWPAPPVEWRLRTLYPDGIGRRIAAVVSNVGGAPWAVLLRSVRADHETLRKRDLSSGTDSRTLRRLRLARVLRTVPRLLVFARTLHRLPAVREPERYAVLRRAQVRTARRRADEVRDIAVDAHHG